LRGKLSKGISELFEIVSKQENNKFGVLEIKGSKLQYNSVSMASKKYNVVSSTPVRGSNSQR